MINLLKLTENMKEEIKELSELASSVVKEHYDPIIGAAQNDYMIGMFQSPEAILRQLKEGHIFYILTEDGKYIGYFACYGKEGRLYLDKFYIHKSCRGRGYGHYMMEHIIDIAKEKEYPAIFLNVNKNNTDSIAIYQKMGFKIIRSEKNPIGHGFYMDDYVLELTICCNG